MFGISSTKASPSSPEPETKDNESEKFTVEMAKSNKINLKNIKPVFIPSNNFAPIANRKIGMRYAAKPKKTNIRLEVIAK